MAIRTFEQEESEELHIARDTLRDPYRARSGSFLFHLLRAFSKTDMLNHDILKPAVKKIIEKYGLSCTCEGGGEVMQKWWFGVDRESFEITVEAITSQEAMEKARQQVKFSASKMIDAEEKE